MLWVSQKDCSLLSDAVAMVKLHKLIERGEELIPDIVLTTAILEHLEMLNMVSITAQDKVIKKSVSH